MWRVVRGISRTGYWIIIITKVSYFTYISIDIKCTVFDINQSMLDEGQKRADTMGLTKNEIEFICGNAE